jgi:hypothetical protein
MRFFKISVLILTLAPLALPQEYSVDWYVIASGGGYSESAGYQVDGTIGQPIIGQSSSDIYIVQTGFWVGLPSGADCVYIPGDCDHNGTALELSDVIAMIGMYRGSVTPPYECSCPPHGDNFTPTADPDGNCVPLELGDVVTEIGAYRGSTTASGCIDCPGTLRLLPGDDDRPLVLPRLKLKIKAAGNSNSD